MTGARGKTLRTILRLVDRDLTNTKKVNTNLKFELTLYQNTIDRLSIFEMKSEGKNLTVINTTQQR